MSDVENQKATSAEVETAAAADALRQAPIDSSIQTTIRRKVRCRAVFDESQIPPKQLYNKLLTLWLSTP